MRIVKIISSVACGVLLLALTTPATATEPMGAWAKVDKITFEPNEAGATRVQVEGVFVVSLGRDGGWAYSSPRRGYMYFTCPAGSEAQCRMEWADFKASIGTPNCAGFGQASAPPGTVRARGTVPSSPDAWPAGASMGIYITPFASGHCDTLKAFASADGGTVPVVDSGTPVNNGASPDSGAPATTPPSTSAPSMPGENSNRGCGIAATSEGEKAIPIAGSILAFAAFAALTRRKRRRARGTV